MADAYETCAFCPRLCRHVCPVALATGHEAATPTAMMTAVFLARRGQLPSGHAGRAAALCVECEACTTHCKANVPVVRLLAAARADYLVALPMEPLAAPVGAGAWVAIECDARRWAEALAHHKARPVARLVTGDHLGAAGFEATEQRVERLAALRQVLKGRVAVTSCARCWSVLQAAGCEALRLSEVTALKLPAPRIPCLVLDPPAADAPRPLLSWGTGGVLAAVHPELAADLLAGIAAGLPPGSVGCMDTCLSQHLQGRGKTVVDPVDWLLQQSSPGGSCQQRGGTSALFCS